MVTLFLYFSIKKDLCRIGQKSSASLRFADRILRREHFIPGFYLKFPGHQYTIGDEKNQAGHQNHGKDAFFRGLF
jgi:hypothetical protein